MSIEDLSESDKITYSTLMEQMNELISIRGRVILTPVKNAKLKLIFDNPDVSFIVKEHIAYKHFRVDAGARWSYENLSGRPLFLLTQSMPLKADTLPYAAKNRNFTVPIVRHMLAQNHAIKPEVKTAFLMQLNDSVMTKDFLLELTQACKQSNLDFTGLLKRARQVLDIPDALPDSWLMKSLFGKTEPTG